jgi:carbohydrate diacid regulator
MLSASTHFEEIASLVTTKVAEILYAPVLIVDNQGKVITSSHPQRDSTTTQQSDRVFGASCLRVPLRHAAEVGEVIVGEPVDQEHLSPRLVQALVELVINQTTSQELLDSHDELKSQLFMTCCTTKFKTMPLSSIAPKALASI